MVKRMVRVIVFLLCGSVLMSSTLTTYADNSFNNQNLADIKESDWESKIDDTVYEKSDSDEAIPVYIWYSDINQNTVEKNVEKEIGFGKEDIDVIDEEIDIKNISKTEKNVRMKKRGLISILNQEEKQLRR